MYPIRLQNTLQDRATARHALTDFGIAADDATTRREATHQWDKSGKTGDFRRSFSKSAALKREVFLFTHLLMIQIAQTAACNRFHVVAQRMARRMLMTRDRVNSNEFRITQEFLALMLGVRRVGVSAAMSDLRERSLIVYSRGTITILDHEGLVALACGCYKTVKGGRYADLIASRQSLIEGIFSHAIHGVIEVIVACTNGRSGWMVVTPRCINFF